MTEKSLVCCRCWVTTSLFEERAANSSYLLWSASELPVFIDASDCLLFKAVSPFMLMDSYTFDAFKTLGENKFVTHYWKNKPWNLTYVWISGLNENQMIPSWINKDALLAFKMLFSLGPAYPGLWQSISAVIRSGSFMTSPKSFRTPLTVVGLQGVVHTVCRLA